MALFSFHHRLAPLYLESPHAIVIIAQLPTPFIRHNVKTVIESVPQFDYLVLSKPPSIPLLRSSPWKRAS